MDLVTLEGLDFTTPAKSGPAPIVIPTGVGNANPKLIGDAVPHFEWMKNWAVLRDAVGNNNSRAAKGSAFGLMDFNPTRTSDIGLFRDRAGNTIVLQMENFAGDNDNPFYQIFETVGAYGNDPIYINVDRGQGDGFLENHLFPELSGNVISKLANIEAQGRRNRVIVVRVQGKPTTWKRVGEITEEWMDTVIDLALNVALPYLGDFIGTAATELVGSLRPTIKNLAKGEPVQVMDLAAAVTLVAPKDMQKEIESAAAFYEAVRTSNYMAAAQIVGKNVKAVDQILNYELGNASTQVNKIAQNAYLMDTVNDVRAQIRSGTAKQEIINNSTMTKTPTIQDLLLAANASMVAAVPRVQEIAGLAVRETFDLTTPAEYRSIYQMAYGYPVTKGSIAGLALRGLVERALTLRRNGVRTMDLPSIVPPGQRRDFAAEISRQTGMGVRVPGQTQKRVLTAAAAAGAGYFFLGF